MPITDDDLLRLDPSDLTDEEVDEILDPNAIGVAELSPESECHAVARRWAQAIEDADARDRILLEARFAGLDAFPGDGHAEAMRIIEEARSAGNYEAEAEAIRSVLTLPFFLRNGSRLEDEELYERGIQLAAHSGAKLIEADLLLYRALPLSVFGSVTEALRITWRARQLISDAGPPSERSFDLLALAALVLSGAAWMSENNQKLTRKYFACSLIAGRRGGDFISSPMVHIELSGQASQLSDLRLARAHALRAFYIGRHTGKWSQAARSLYYLCRSEISAGDLSAAKETLERFRRYVNDQAVSPDVVSPFECLPAALIAFEEGDLERGIELGLKAVDGPFVGLETKLALMNGLASSYESMGDKASAIVWLRRAAGVQREMYENRIAGSATGLTLNDQIARLRDEYGDAKETARRSDSLLRGILPPSAYAEFQQTGECRARHLEGVAIFYSDFAGFTQIAAGMHPDQLVDILGQLFGAFDRIMAEHGCERVETIGDAYLAVAGLDATDERSTGSRVADMVHAAIEVARYLIGRNGEFRALGTPEFQARIGVHAGSIVGGLVGTERVRYAIFGDAVNTAQRLEAGGQPGSVTVSAEAREAILGTDGIELIERPAVSAKGKGDLQVWEVALSAASE
ncbi:MAG: adenylate/guanylate cyclase domain-containing protein [Spirochaetaceae bacterium]|nr:MAG: adenylate/guanylate cyclase domain-containing protein [Spirochaetaceae bacterium]